MNKLGFGFLRLPLTDPNDDTSIDYQALNGLVDAFLQMGGKYFDTAYTYHGGKSEEAVRRALAERYPRERFLLADKLPSYKMKSHEDCRVYFEEQRKRCGVEYFDVYMLHWLNAAHYEIAEKCDEFGFLRELKERGEAKKIGFSFHDTAELLDRILTEHPEVDYVLLQINYLDWENEAVQSGKCYEIAVKHNKPVIVMEPVKGGALADIPAEAAKVFAEMDAEAGPAKWALRFAQSLPQVEIVLSGMNSLGQIADNMADMEPIGEKEWEGYCRAAKIIRGQTAIPCTGCAYCANHCPKKIAIPQYFKLYNEYCRNKDEDWKIQPVYDGVAKAFGKASDCIRCRRCEKNCPQKIEITHWLKEIAKAFE